MTDPEIIADRRRIRRKLSFWRIISVVAAIALVTALAVNIGFPETRSDHIARIDISGVITDDEPLLELIDKAAKNQAAKALVISISSPGGTTYGGERLHEALVAAGALKPVVADVRTLAASAGYMIAASTDHIVAGESSIVGSIGVIFQYAQASDLLDKIGVRIEDIKSSPMKAEPSPFHNASEEAKAMIRSMVLDSYDWFVDLVAERRKMDRAQVLALADGSIFTGRQGLANGLVDAVGGEDEIRTYLKGRGIDETLKIVKWEPDRGSPSGLLNIQAASLVERYLGMPGRVSDEIDRLSGGKLFLDGLLSVWQVGGQPARDN
ncbi:signal peptide peptidase SppA [Hoeflea sp. G2-23]|uniref:Signal peptide peptidase SppA n=1 Tax=Hoeflea algicola TaxID=2983763 RepID=A0ABT3ZCW3_9HYPH|nr:signal peptide peptidase SppA [Hoeflea algicola]MCY0149558.1 signal peptide peptidase SppA [Hoeflea algicola]